MRNCPLVAKNYGYGHQRAQPYPSSWQNGSAWNARKKNNFYVFQTRDFQDISPDVVTSMLKAFHIDMYALLDPSASLSFVNPFIAKKFFMLPDVLLEPFYYLYTFLLFCGG